jgi:hypothetical protein
MIQPSSQMFRKSHIVRKQDVRRLKAVCVYIPLASTTSLRLLLYLAPYSDVDIEISQESG